ncbi:MAG: Ig-like domain-containing protein, partial [Aeromonas hydrophila]|uniref:Ig-like domain-containing protein n=1 Tax=Vogesella sp. TaxID=1904252 RepID=UPI003F2BE0A3
KPDGTWSVTPTQPLPEGAANLPVVATDPAGNTTNASVPVTIDTTGRALTAKLDPTSDSGTPGDGITNDTTPTISGTGNAGDSIKVTTPTGEVLTTTVKPDGTWSVTPTQPLPEGAANIPVVATDPAGNTTNASVPVTIDTTGPALTAKLDPASDSGTPGDGITNDTTPTIIGTGNAGDSIKVTTPTGEVLTTTVKPDGTWSVTPTQPLPEGAANLPVVATDPAGNTTNASVPVTIDSGVPNGGNAPTVTIAEDTNNDGYINASEAQGPVDLKVAFDPSKVEVGDTVKVTVGGNTQDIVVSATDKANGFVTASTPLPADGSTLDVSAVIVDKAGNSSAPGSDSAIVDLTAPVLTAQLDPASDSGTPGDGITNDTTPTISGTGNVGDSIKVTTPTGEVLTTTVKPDGTWSVTPTHPLPEGAANLPVVATDPAGNTTTASVPVT